ncbi:aspartokinase [Gangjinia marincola]|uniref:Homoserine dehydrogenase n=1 Tax=Gangjinia marincola TaxID=578463 RepID=A0ABN1MDW5_9FLAO
MKNIQLILFGIGNVGGTLIDQIIAQKEKLRQQHIDLQFSAILNSSNVFFPSHNLTSSWRASFEENSMSYTFNDVLKHIQKIEDKIIIAIDATASDEVVNKYETLIEAGCHLVSANKIANTISYDFYIRLRKKLSLHQRQFEYETNVGAGLPVIETVKKLHQSGDEITKVRGVFSGSLSYLFNRFSSEEVPFSQLIKDAKVNGYTEPDPRDDLSGKDVGRKLLILARELQLEKEFKDVQIQSLIPPHLNGESTVAQFEERMDELDVLYGEEKSTSTDKVLRYIGELDVSKEALSVSLQNEHTGSAIGQLQGADNVVEIYTKDYDQHPLVIKGAGAGGAVTARGVFNDILKVVSQC